jgi:hypothetical protein
MVSIMIFIPANAVSISPCTRSTSDFRNSWSCWSSDDSASSPSTEFEVKRVTEDLIRSASASILRGRFGTFCSTTLLISASTFESTGSDLSSGAEDVGAFISFSVNWIRFLVLHDAISNRVNTSLTSSCRSRDLPCDTCGYTLANDGHDTRALQHYLGHKNIQHTVRYTERWPRIGSGTSGNRLENGCGALAGVAVTAKAVLAKFRESIIHVHRSTSRSIAALFSRQ